MAYVYPAVPATVPTASTTGVSDHWILDGAARADIVLHRSLLQGITVGHRFDELRAMAVLHLSWPGARHSQRAVVQHPAWSSLLSRCAECDSHAAIWCDTDTATCDYADSACASGLPLLSLRAVGTDVIGYRLVLRHDDSSDHVRQPQHLQSELDLRWIDFVHSVN